MGPRSFLSLPGYDTFVAEMRRGVSNKTYLFPQGQIFGKIVSYGWLQQFSCPLKGDEGNVIYLEFICIMNIYV